MSLAFFPYDKKSSSMNLFLTFIVVIFIGNFFEYFDLSFVIPSLTSPTNWLDVAITINISGSESILLFFIWLLEIKILPVLDRRYSHSITRAFKSSFSAISFVFLIPRFFDKAGERPYP